MRKMEKNNLRNFLKRYKLFKIPKKIRYSSDQNFSIDPQPRPVVVVILNRQQGGFLSLFPKKIYFVFTDFISLVTIFCKS